MDYCGGGGGQRVSSPPLKLWGGGPGPPDPSLPTPMNDDFVRNIFCMEKATLSEIFKRRVFSLVCLYIQYVYFFPNDSNPLSFCCMAKWLSQDPDFTRIRSPKGKHILNLS